MAPDHINRATAGNVFMLGAGGVFVVWLSAYFGRLPVLVFFQSLNLATTAWSGSATGFKSFMASRILHGFFGTVAAAVSQILFCRPPVADGDVRGDSCLSRTYISSTNIRKLHYATI